MVSCYIDIKGEPKLKKTIVNGEICFFINGFNISYSPLKGEYRVCSKSNSGESFLLRMIECEKEFFLICSNGDIEDIVFSIFGLRHNIYLVYIDGKKAVDFDVFGRHVKEKCSEKK